MHINNNTPAWLASINCCFQRYNSTSLFHLTIRSIVLGLILLPVGLANAETKLHKWVKPYKPVSQEEIKQQMPFYPSRTTTNGQTLTPEMFEPAEVCKGCHSEIYQQWEKSVMAHSWEDPIYRALFKRASAATDAKVDNFCIACHSPIGMTSMNATAATLDENDDDLPGVNCEVCHNIRGITGNDNGAYILSPNREKHIKVGPRNDANSPYHKTEFSDLQTKSEFCSVCHNVSHPFNSTPIERTYDEWQESAYNEQGVQCQDCHMTPGPGQNANPGKSAIMGKEREHIFSHEFTGGNSTLHQYFNDHDSAELAREMLRSAATIEFVELSETLSPGQLATVKVKVANVGAGHKLPTGFPEGREVWVDFSVNTPTNRQIYRSGAVVDGHTESGTRNFKVTLGDANGNVVDLNVWEVDRVLSDTRILPNGYSIVEYTFLVPDDIDGEITLNATLNYWPFSQQLVDELLGKDKLTVDIVEMTSVSAKVSVAKEESKKIATIKKLVVLKLLLEMYK
ncbi:cytochrome c family protein [Photobacterium sp. SDRW27]|uniref:multiheme c-type cytochrome n=1 Tax=Photobacterium obscurum TaxID=2829490 RepID=UPI00224306C6|nr:multiheme c-type cytochrome [Photobacterium obscurum]MCW8331997.1 cytochrome c family protein [Photobacterium obscurum]